MAEQSDATIDVDGLVRKAQQGEATAFASLYEHFFDQVYRYVSFKIGSPAEAEDITGEVFVRMLESISSFKWLGYPFSSWLFRIAHNLIVDHYRKKGKKRTVTLESVASTVGESFADVDGYIDQQLQMEDIQKAMEKLTKLQREVITLRFAAGLSVAETAQAVGKKDNAVKALQHAGLKKLKRLLDTQYGQPRPVIPLGYQED